MKKHLFFHIIVVIALGIIIGILAVSCNGGGNTNTETKTETDSFYTAGFTKGNASVTDVANDLFFGLFNTIKSVSTSKPTSVTVSSLETEGIVNLANKSYTASLKLNYSETVKSDNVLRFEVMDSNGEVIFSVYHINDDENPMLYVRSGDTKLQIPYPIQSMHILAPITSLDTMTEQLSDVIRLKTGTQIKYEYQKNDLQTYTKHFYAAIDLTATLKALVSNTAYNQYATDLNFLFKNLFNVTSAQVSSNGLPPMTLEVQFKTVEGAQSTFNAGRLSEIDVKFDVSRSSSHTSTIFEGLAYNLTLKLNELICKSELITNIIPVKLLENYTRYDLSPFKLAVDFYYVSESTKKHAFVAEIDYNSDNINASTVAIYIRNPDGLNRLSIYYKDCTLNFNYLDAVGNKITNIQCAFDLEKLMDEVLALSPESEASVYNRSLVYVLGALTLPNEETVRYKYELTKLNTLLSITPEDIQRIINESTTLTANGSPTTFYDAFSAASGISFANVVATSVAVEMDLTSAFITQIEEVVIPEERTTL
ncbi:MAG: hypothetical protein LBE09_06050 [Christensenellaceae bacterium]|jgi:hypothetical protein|nr:hypothetical protein [Christensenellaceae bacterium]